MIHPTTHNPYSTCAVYLDGPESDIDDDGEEIPIWTVCVGNDYGDPTGPVSRFSDRDSARAYARRIAASKRLELVDEAGLA